MAVQAPAPTVRVRYWTYPLEFTTSLEGSIPLHFCRGRAAGRKKRSMIASFFKLCPARPIHRDQKPDAGSRVDLRLQEFLPTNRTSPTETEHPNPSRRFDGLPDRRRAAALPLAGSVSYRSQTHQTISESRRAQTLASMHPPKRTMAVAAPNGHTNPVVIRVSTEHIYTGIRLRLQLHRKLPDLSADLPAGLGIPLACQEARDGPRGSA